MKIKTTNNKVVVKIDKVLQAEKRNKIGNFYIPSYLMDFKNNLQFGEVLSFGPNVSEICPEIEVGCVAIFHHAVEYKVLSTNVDEQAVVTEDTHYLFTDDDGNEIRFLHATKDLGSELFGVYKNGQIHPCNNIIFCAPEVKQSDWQKIKGIYINNEQDEIYIKDQLEIIGHGISEYKRTLTQIKPNELNQNMRENIISEIGRFTRQRDEMAKKLKRITLAELTVQFVPKSILNVAPGDKILIDNKLIYPLTIFNTTFALIRDFKIIHGKTINNLPVPINDRLIVKQDSPKEKSDAGIIFPDTAKEKPNSGIVISVGESYEYETNVKSGDRIVFHNLGAIEIFIDDAPFLIIHSQNILAKDSVE